MGATHVQPRPSWSSPLVMTAALFTCLAAFVPFAGKDLQDDFFWLLGFGLAWLASAAGLMIWDGAPGAGRLRAVAYHLVAIIALVLQLVLGAGMLFVDTLMVGILTGTVRDYEVAPAAVIFWAVISVVWFSGTAWMLRLWQRRSWWILALPLASWVLVAVLYVIAIATSTGGDH
jgi:hypothetical protein